jgi:hypothetical protein
VAPMAEAGMLSGTRATTRSRWPRWLQAVGIRVICGEGGCDRALPVAHATTPAQIVWTRKLTRSRASLVHVDHKKRETMKKPPIATLLERPEPLPTEPFP